MKRTCLLLALLCPYLLYAQTTVYEDLSQDTLQTVDEVFENVDLTQVPSGLLLDKTFPFADPTPHDGLHLDADNLLNFDTFGLLYATMYGASVGANTTPPPPDVYMNASDAFDNGGPLNLALARIAYHQLRPDAIAANLLDTLNNRIYDVPGRAEAPYSEHETFFAAPVSTVVVGADVRFQFDPSLALTNTSTTITTLNVDFGDSNGPVILTPGSIYEVTYSGPGVVTLIVTATYSDGAVRQSHATLAVRADPLGRMYSETADFSNSFTSNGDVLNVDVMTACPDGLIRKPFFYVMGFNTFDSEGEKQKKFADMIQFFTDDYGGVTASDESILDLLHAEGYDVIYCDWEVSQNNLYDHIATLRQAIDWVNGLKAASGSEAKNVMFGRSMGGLMSRYALLEMESEGLDHQTEKLLTMDTGHRGNNTPLGLQAMAYDMANMKVLGTVTLSSFVKKLRKGLAILNGMGTRQLNIYHLANDPDLSHSAWFYATINQDVHTPFFASLDALGAPQHFEMVYMSNGSLTGQSNPLLAPGEKMFQTEFGPFIFIVANFWMRTRGFAVSDGRTDADPEKIYSSIAILTLWKIPMILHYQRLKKGGLDPLDTCPGGNDPIGDEILGFLTQTYATEPFYTVCPTYSALNLDNSFVTASVMPPVVIPPLAGLRWIGSTDASVSSFGINQHNQKHVTFNENLARFFLRETVTSGGPATVAGSGGSLWLTENYNFGELQVGTPGLFTPNALTRPHTIPADRTLHVNRDLPLGNVDDPDNPQAATGVDDYEFFLRDGVDCDGPTGPAHLTVDPGGQLLVGDWSVGNTATVYLQDYASLEVDGYLELDRFSTLVVEAHTTLRITGRVRLNADARILVEPGGILSVLPGGELELGSRARVEVGSNAFLWHRPTGIIKAGVDAEVIIEQGARYELFEGSVARLWSGQNPYGTACIRIFGHITWNGEPQFSGNGHFSFEPTAQLHIPYPDDPNDPDDPNVPREFRLRGQREDFRFLTLKGLQVPKGADVHLSRGIVQSSGLHTEGGGRITFEDTHWRGSDGLDAVAPQRVIARRSTFTDMAAPLSVREVTQPTAGTTVRECTFTGCRTGLYVENNRFGVEVIESTFDGGTASEAAGLEAIWGVDARSIRVVDSEIYGYLNATADDQTGGVQHAAVQLNNVRSFYAHGTDIHGNDYGIAAADDIGKGAYGSNVFLRAGTRVRENGVGVHVQDGGFNPQGLDHGLVSMRCSELTGNVNGITGEDVLLDIDAFHQAQGQTYAYTNHFQHLDFHNLFDICLVDRQDHYQDGPNLFVLNARANYWGTANADPVDEVPIHISLVGPSNPCQDWGNQLTMLVDPIAAGPVQECPPADPGGNTTPGNGGDPTLADPPKSPSQAPATQCLVEIGGAERVVHAQYQEAWLAHEQGDTELAAQLFAPVAALDAAALGTAYARDADGKVATELAPEISYNQCSHLRQVASVFVDPEALTADARLLPGATPHDVLDPLWVAAARGTAMAVPPVEPGSVRLVPNPASAYFRLRTELSGPADYRCYDAVGRLVASGRFEGRARVTTTGWRSGLYTVEVRCGDRAPQVQRVVIERP